MMSGNEIAGILTVDYFKPSGKWYDTTTTEVSFNDLLGNTSMESICKLFSDRTGRTVPHPYFTSFIRLEYQHTKANHFCRYLIQPLETDAT